MNKKPENPNKTMAAAITSDGKIVRPDSGQQLAPVSWCKAKVGVFEKCPYSTYTKLGNICDFSKWKEFFPEKPLCEIRDRRSV